ncbi:putative reverse transcriptase domain-containing protein [Tanacetum coccineum]
MFWVGLQELLKAIKEVRRGYAGNLPRYEAARAYVVAPSESRGYAGNLPRCNHCNSHHNGQCPPKCRRCQRTGHQEKDCRTRVPGAADDNFIVIELRVPHRREGRVPESFLASATNNLRRRKLTLESDCSMSEPGQLYCDSSFVPITHHRRVVTTTLLSHKSEILSAPGIKATVADLENEFKNFGSIKLGGVQVRGNKKLDNCFDFGEFKDLSSMQNAIQICLFCQQRGHSLNNCPDKKEDNVAQKLCYNCGAFEHSLAMCPQPLEDGNFLQYAREWNTNPKLCHIAQFVLFQVFTLIPRTQIVEAFEVIVPDKATMKHTIIPSIEAKNRKGIKGAQTFCELQCSVTEVVPTEMRTVLEKNENGAQHLV